MAAFVKAKIKAARDAIGKKDFRTAQLAAEEALHHEADNYNALVFLGYASLELQEVDKSEQAYLKARNSGPEQALAWQGLERVYTRANMPQKLLDVLNNLVDIFMKIEDVSKCAETVQKIIELRKKSGTRAEIIGALSLLLPSSPLYPFLSALPPPDYTQPTSTTTFPIQDAIYNSLPLLEEIMTLSEQEEKLVVDKEVQKRRQRIDAGTPQEIRNAVVLEIAKSSNLLSLYSEIVNHPNTPDQLRRSTEGKILRHKLQLLYALPPADHAKTQLRQEIDDIVQGTVLIEVPDQLAWTIAIESKNARTVEMYDISLLRSYVRLFPASPLSNVISGCMYCLGIPLFGETEADAEEAKRFRDMDYEVAFQLASDGLADCQDSILAYRLITAVYASEGDYPSVIKVAETGLKLTSMAERHSGRDLAWVKHALNSFIATALTHHYPPKYHQRALGILEQLLSMSPDDAMCLLERGYILRHAGRYEDARDAFLAAHGIFEADNAQMPRILEAREEAAWCLTLSGQYDQALVEISNVISSLDDTENTPERKAQAWWRLGRTLWDKRDHSSRKESYSHFIASLKYHSAFAPAYTSLGVWYSEFSNPPDLSRATKCFQKAVELDLREADAARRLAEGFADESDWDLVEVVARRTIEGEGGAEDQSGIKALATGNIAAAARYKPLNAWAWKAVGVVEMSRGNHESAIIALQIALRANQSDHRAWTRLGEAYAKSGRPAAALKALSRSREISQDDWTAVYFIGEVYRQMGQFDLAIATFEPLLVDRPDEVGVLLAMAESHFSRARQEFAAGYHTRFEESLAICMELSMKLVNLAPGFRRIIWKTIADAIFELSKITLFVNPTLVLSAVRPVCEALPERSEIAVIVESLSATELSGKFGDNRDRLEGLDLHWLAIACYSTRVGLCKNDQMTEGSALFDLSIAIHSIIPKLVGHQSEKALSDAANSAILDALKHSPGNEWYWNALGNIKFLREPKLAQHAYIKALEIDSKNPTIWTNLGVFYLHHGDTDLANQSFYKAQVSDPDYGPAWIGQAMVATINQHLPEARALFEHALILFTPTPWSEYEYSYRVFTDPQLGMELFALICERLHQYDLALELLERSIKFLEAAYEKTEDAGVEYRYAVANVNIGRVRLAIGDYASAKASFEIVINLLEGNATDIQESSISPSIVLAQARFGLGLSCHKLGELENALAAFEAGLEETSVELADVRSHIAILLAQTLWAMRSDETREAGKDQLLQLIADDPNNLRAITSLAAMGIVSHNNELTHAALTEILNVSGERRLELDPRGEVNRLLFLDHSKAGRDLQAEKILKDVLGADPMSLAARLDLVEHLLCKRHVADACDLLAEDVQPIPTPSDRKFRLLAILRTMERGNNGRESLNGSPVSQGKPIRLAERATLLAPWNRTNWHVLAYVQCANR
ncbi:TPR-like protein [Cantharellus anzutake]|uniref:TPR-like protein n=1 Tax=Cantharellus anzutake TaxID=1750568 RepID=UPI001908D0B8|nr:TPR-like protein [Cantharellus anzutake]KAF8342132.1 TPR-like protein [Cantharellus anzutake]